MPRSARVAAGGLVFHVLNRGVGRMTVFEKDEDYEASDRLIAETINKKPMRIWSSVLKTGVGQVFGGVCWARRKTSRC